MPVATPTKEAAKSSGSSGQPDGVWLDLHLHEDAEDDVIAAAGTRGGRPANLLELRPLSVSGLPSKKPLGPESEKLISWASNVHGSEDPPAPDGAKKAASHYGPDELESYDCMLSWMIATYFMCLGFGWGLLLLDYAWTRLEHRPKEEPWASDVVIIGGASAVLSPIIQWSSTILQTKRMGDAMAEKRLAFLRRMLAVYVGIVGVSTLVAVVRFSLGEDGTLHHFISTTSNHLVLARISASLISWGAGKAFIRWYKERLSAGPIF